MWGLVYISILGGVRVFMEFAFGWCDGGCESVGAILVICGICMMCVSHCVVVLLRIFVEGVKKTY